MFYYGQIPVYPILKYKTDLMVNLLTTPIPLSYIFDIPKTTEVNAQSIIIL